MNKLRIRRAGVLALATAFVGASTTVPVGVATAISSAEPIFTQYVEGSGNNKAIEVANVSGATLDLSDYTIERYTNGSPTASATIELTGSLADGDVFVVANPSAVQAVLDVADVTSGNANWNGDDALVLRKDSTSAAVDSIGRVGEDPGSAWSGNGVSTQNDTLCRLDSVTGGDTDPFGLFDPSAEWEAKGQDVFDGLGDIGCSPVQDGDLLLTQYVEGSGNNKALEVANTTGVEIDLSNYSILVSFNGGSSTTTIPLVGTLADGDVHVVASASADAGILAVTDQTTGGGLWNGDDAIVLQDASLNPIDSIGQLGVDPGSAWSTNGISTQNDTLCRLDSVAGGDTDPTDAFDPSIEWESKGQDNIDGLGELGCDAPPDPSALVLTQYLEGTSNNKAIEITNFGSDPVDLSTFDVERYSNGSTSPFTIDLVGSVGPGESFVLANTSANADILAVADQTSGGANWNGDDGIVLRDGDGNVVDSIGQLGVDPGSQWEANGVGTQNETLCRNPGVLTGDTDFTDVFDPSAEWFAKGVDNTDGLGDPGCVPQPVGDLIITQYVEGSSNNKAIEIANFTGADLDLNDYAIEVYANGSATPTSTASALGLAAEPIFDGTVYVVANPNANAAILAAANETSGSINWNGNDAIVLRNTATGLVIDSIGQVGVDPGSAWSANGVSTQNDTLCRNDGVGSNGGDTDPTDPFDPSAEYTSLGQDSIIGLGEVGCVDTSAGECGTGGVTLISVIQGSGAASPLDGQSVVIEGVVVADFQGAGQIGGFHVQEEDADADADPATSEGIYVFDGSLGVDVAVGDVVRVRGEVEEFFELTELTNVSDVVACTDASGTATPVTLTLPYPAGFDLETIEGMAVDVPGPLAVTDTFNAARFGEVRVSINEPLVNPTQAAAPGPAANAVAELNDRSQILLDDARAGSELYPVSYFGSDDTLRRGDTFDGTMSTVLQYAFNAYRFLPTFDASVPDLFTRVDERPAGPPDVGGDLKVASFNVLNYFLTLDQRGADTEVERIRQRDKIVSAVTRMDAAVVGLIELENGGAALTDLVAGFNDATAPGTYAEITTGPIGTDQIAVGFVYQPALVTPVGPFSILDSSVDPTFIDTKNRPVLIQTFETNDGDRVTLAISHFKSKGSPCDDVGDPNAGDEQGNCNGTRTAAAAALANYLATDPTGSGSSDFLIMGDINAYPNEDPITAFTDAGYVDLITQFHPDAQSFVFFGEGGRLDHALASPSLAPKVTDANEWSINAAEPRGLDYNTSVDGDNPPQLYAPDEFRSSDHDPVIVGLEFGPKQAIMIVGRVNGAGQPPFRDRPMLAIVEDLGIEVELVDDDDATAADAADKDLILIASSVSPSKVGDEFTDVTQPLISWEGFLFDDLGFNERGGGRNGETSTTQTVLEIVD
ncbi:MAG: ExeM/NucH family extracellular endonuclease, partial [Actinomycetota bacterium]